MRKLVLLLLILPLLTSLTSGCWDMLDIEKEAFILSMSIDTLEKTEENEAVMSSPPFAPRDRIHVTLEVFSPLQAKNKNIKNTIIISQNASPIAEPIRLAQAQLPRRLSLVHLRAVVVGEEYARQGIKDLMDFLDRSPQIADRFRLSFLYLGRGEEVLAASVVTESNVAEYITKAGELDTAYTFHRTVSFNEMYEHMRHSQGTYYATMLYLDPQKKLSKLGASVFKNWQLIGWLNAYEVRGANWVTGNIDQVSLAGILNTTEDTEGAKVLATYNILSASSKIRPIINDTGQLSFLVQIKTEGFLTEIYNPPTQGTDRKLLQQLQDTMAGQIKQEAEWIIAKSQKEAEADFLGFGAKLFNHEPRLYNSLDWESFFPGVPITVQVEAHISRLGNKR